jgi:hypothetical protein
MFRFWKSWRSKMCPVCNGRGEVEAGVTDGVIEYGTRDHLGHRSTYPTRVRVNPWAYDAKIGDVWYVQTNPLVPLWGIAFCMKCHGTGRLIV